MWSAEKKGAVWLNAFGGLTPAKMLSAIKYAPFGDLFENPDAYQKELSNLFTDVQWDSLLKSRENATERYFQQLDDKNIGVLLQSDAEFPDQLKEIYNPPALFYYVGDISLIKTRMLGIVGTRNCTRYGLDTATEFASALASAGLTIVSGMARGIDGYAQSAALSVNGKTVGVLGTGIDKIYPAENKDLFLKVREKGLLLSEYHMGLSGAPYRFPERNRIISGLSEGLLVIEAGEKSGSLITANLALEQGRNVYVVPTNLNNKRGQGCNYLIKTLQGALVTSPDDIAEDLGMHGKVQKADAIQLDFTEERVVAALQERECHFDELLKITGLGVSDLNALLSVMEMKGLLHKLEQNYYGV